MKVLIVTGSYPPMRCGVGDYAEHLAQALSRDVQLEVSVLTSELEPAAPHDQNLEIYRVMPTWHKNSLSRYSEVLRRIRPDIVHIQYPTQGYDFLNGLTAIALRTRYHNRVPVVVTLHEFLPRWPGRAGRHVYGLALVANRIVVVRPDYRARIPWYARAFIKAAKLVFIPNASVIPAVKLSVSEREAVKERVGCVSSKLVAFFGFSYPPKGVDLLFRIADPSIHHLLLIGDLSPEDSYHAHLRKLAESDRWKGRVTITGFTDATEVGRLLAASDAAVFPFRAGGGIWNSSVHAAASQGTFVLTTSRERSGYDAAANIYYARPEAVDEMRQALLDCAGMRRHNDDLAADSWSEIAAAHKELYASVVAGRALP